MGQIQIKDSTAQGVAKVRHSEALHEPSKRLYYNQYVHAMYPGSFVQRWMGLDGISWVYSMIGANGVQEMLTIRTKWLDEQVLQAAPLLEQLVILGAGGYDTRTFRLDLPNDNFFVFEVNQPDVQAKKIHNLKYLVKNGEEVVVS
jgi:O-methyltransferase involved in polyketide biosynthesis